MTTDGRSIVINNANMDIPENQYFTCSGTPGGSRDQTSSHPYWTLPNSIVLNPAYTVTREKQSRLSDCIIRPTWYVPQSSPYNIPAQKASDLVQLVRNFTGLATSCDGKNCPMEDMFIIGFDTCEDNDQSLKSVLSDLQQECLVVQPGMTVDDLSASHITSGTTVSSVDCSTNTIHISQPTTGTIANEKIRFAGCGYPAGYPWLGNCASTTLLLGGTGNVPPPDDNEEEAQGPTCEYIHSFGNEIQVHVINAPTTDCVNFVIAGGGGVGDQIDPDSVGIWFEGNATKTQFSNGRIAGAVTSILDMPNPQSSGIGISNAEVPGHIIVGPDSDLVLTGLHGNAPSGDFAYVSSSAASLQASGISLPAWTMYFDDPAIFPKIYCAGNSFATALCAQVKASPSCLTGATGCGSVAGNDLDFDVTTNGTATSVSILLGGHYPAKPICRATANSTLAGASASASVTSVTWQPYATTVVFKTSVAVPHIYGSCRPATG